MGSAADLLSAYGDDSSSPAPDTSAPLTVNLARPATAPASPFPSIDQPLGAQPHDSSAAALHSLYTNDNKDDSAKKADNSATSAAAPISTTEDVAKSAGSGVVRGVAGAPFGLASLGSMGADAIVSGGDYLVRKALGLGEPSKEWKEKQAKAAAAVAASPIASAVPSAPEAGSAVQAGLTPYLHEPQTTAGKYAETAGEFAPMVALNPESLGSLGTAGGAAKTVGTMVAAPAIASETAGQATEGTAAEPYARMAGGILGGAAPGAAMRTGSAIVHSNPVVGALDAVGVHGPAQSRAGQRLLEQAQDPQAVINQLQTPPNPEAPAGPEQFQTVPGSTPTTFQLTGDQGLGAAQRGDATVQPQAYKDIESAQNAARQAHISQIEPQAHADAVVTHLDDQLGTIRSDADKAVQAAKDKVQVEGTTQIEQGAPPEVRGEELQAHLADLNAQAKAKEGALHQAVDPHGVLVSSVDPVDKAMTKAYGSLSPTAQGFISPVEQQFSNIVQNYGPTIPYRELGDLSSQISAAMRQERMSNGSTPTLRRLSMLMDGVKDAMSTTARQVAHTDAQGVKAGVLDPNNALAARLRDVQGPQDVRSAQRSSSNDREGNGPLGTGQTQLPSGQGGAPSEGRGAVASGAGNPNVSGGAQAAAAAPDAVAPPIRFEADPEVLARQKAANAATVDRYKRFGEGSVGQVLAPGKRSGEFRTPAASVPNKLFRTGPEGYTATKSYFDAAGPEGAPMMHSLATSKLADIVAKDGGLTEAGLTTWKRQYGHSLRAIDEATPGFSGRFDNTAKALDEVERTTAEQNAKIDAYQKGVIGDMLGAKGQGDEAVTSRLSTMLRDQKNGVAKMRDLVVAAKDNPDAMAGLRKGVADALAKDLETKTKEGASDVNALRPAGSYRAAVDKAAPVLREALTPEQVKNYYDVADDLDKTQRSITGNKLKNSSNTAQDTHAAGTHGAAAPGHGGISTTKLAIIEGATLAGEHLFDSVTHSIPMSAQVATAAVGTFALLRKMGINSVQKYYSDALQHPDRAAQYVKAFTGNPNRQGRLNSILRKSFINQHKAPDDNGDQGPNEPPPSGPFSPNGRETSPPAATASSETTSRQVDERGRVEPTISPLPFREPEQPQADIGNAPLTGRQARVLLADGHTPEAVRTMDHGARAAALQDALARGVEPVARIRPSDRDALGGAMPHRVHDGRSADGRFAQQPGGLEQLAPIVGYHASSADFDKFDLSKLGTGEGLAVEGHGLYFHKTAEQGRDTQRLFSERDKKPATLYQANLNTTSDNLIKRNVPFSQQSPSVQQALEKLGLAKKLTAEDGVPDEAIGRLHGPSGVHLFNDAVRKFGSPDKAAQALDAAGVHGIEYRQGRGTNYVLFNHDRAEIVKKIKGS